MFNPLYFLRVAGSSAATMTTLAAIQQALKGNLSPHLAGTLVGFSVVLAVALMPWQTEDPWVPPPPEE